MLYYDIAIRPIRNTITDEVISMYYSYTMSNAYENGSMNTIVPFIGIYDFMNKLDKKELIEYIENDESDYFPANSAWIVIR